jgi:hypothetical protein
MIDSSYDVYTTSDQIILALKMFGGFILIVGILQTIRYYYNKWTGNDWMNK